MPTPTPGLKRVPRWRTMISPPVTTWPAKTFTPRNWGFESRPLRLEPRPFLCAISWSPSLLGLGRGSQVDPGDPDARELLAVTGAALVAALGLELEDADLRTALVAEDGGLDANAAEIAAGEQGPVPAGRHQRLEGERGAFVGGQPLDEQGRPLLYAVLLAAGPDHGIGAVGHGVRSLARFGDFGRVVGSRLGTRTAPSASAAAAPRP